MSLSLSPSASLSSAQRQVDSPLTPELQLLLTCARLELTLPQQQRLRHLCREISDWSALMYEADRHLIAPLVYRHLKVSAFECVPASVIAVMHSLCKSRIIRTMTMAAEQQRLVQQILQPLDVPYALFKGPSLAQRYYGELGLRQCRDIDVLIASNRLFDVVEAVLAQGYQIDPGMLSDLYTEPFSSHKDLETACRYNSVMTVISPQGVGVELHRTLDSKGHIFNPGYLLTQAQSFVINGVSCQVLPTDILFVYICYHHSCHQWARLHWVADLDAIQAHPSFDRLAVETFAAAVGLKPRVSSSLVLHQVCGTSAPDKVKLEKEVDRSMRDVCLQGLACQELIKSSHKPRLYAFDAWPIRVRYLVIGFLCPTYADYKAMPLPKAWQWVYYLTRPIRLGWRMLNNPI